MSNKIKIFEESISITDNSRANSIEIFNDSNTGFIKIFDIGPKGDKGDRGPAGFSGAGEPFYSIVTGELYATTASIAINAFISSSIIPYTGSFDLGSNTNPWKNIFVSNSVFIGDVHITTSSFGFDNYIIKSIATDQQEFIVKSGSVSMSFNNSGIFTIPDFQILPNAARCGMVVSGSDLFVGI